MNLKKIIISFAGLALGLALATNVFATSSVTGHKVIIDAGHGGSDSGSTECADYPEKQAALDIANRLKAMLEVDGATVYMTRTDDLTLTNEDRYTLANSTDGEVLVSIHLNGSTNHSVNGTQGLYGKRNKDKKFAEVVHSRLAGELSVADLGVTNFASGVLLKSRMPATIQETVFISNTNECAMLTDGTGTRQQEIAQSLYNGLTDWFSLPPDSGGHGNNQPGRPW